METEKPEVEESDLYEVKDNPEVSESELKPENSLEQSTKPPTTVNDIQEVTQSELLDSVDINHEPSDLVGQGQMWTDLITNIRNNSDEYTITRQNKETVITADFRAFIMQSDSKIKNKDKILLLKNNCLYLFGPDTKVITKKDDMIEISIPDDQGIVWSRIKKLSKLDRKTIQDKLQRYEKKGMIKIKDGKAQIKLDMSSDSKKLWQDYIEAKKVVITTRDDIKASIKRLSKNSLSDDENKIQEYEVMLDDTKKELRDLKLKYFASLNKNDIFYYLKEMGVDISDIDIESNTITFNSIGNLEI